VNGKSGVLFVGLKINECLYESMREDEIIKTKLPFEPVQGEPVSSQFGRGG